MSEKLQARIDQKLGDQAEKIEYQLSLNEQYVKDVQTITVDFLNEVAQKEIPTEEIVELSDKENRVLGFTIGRERYSTGNLDMFFGIEGAYAKIVITDTGEIYYIDYVIKSTIFSGIKHKVSGDIKDWQMWMPKNNNQAESYFETIADGMADYIVKYS